MARRLSSLRALQKLSCVTLVLTVWCGLRSQVVAGNYQDTVIRMVPNFYYELNETDTAGGAIDTMGNAAANGVFNGNYGPGGPEVGGPGALEVFGGVAVPGLDGVENLAHYSNNQGHVTLGDGELYGSAAMTVALFFKAGPAQGGDRIFTNNIANPLKSFQINTANDGLVLAVDPANAGGPAERTLFVEDNSGPDRRLIDAEAGWFHVVASTEGKSGAERAANFRLWINGVDRTDNLQPNVTGWGIDTGLAKIGGRRADPFDTTTHSGAQDEVAIWLDRVLTDEEVALLWDSAITEKAVPLIFTDITLTDAKGGGSDVMLTWQSRPNRTYSVFTSPDLKSWEELDDGVNSDGDSTSYIVSGVSSDTGRVYYRVEQVTQ